MEPPPPVNNAFRIWQYICFVCLTINCFLCGGVLFLDLNLDNMESTKIYIGFFQALIGISLSFICSLAIYFHSKTPIVFYAVCSIILNLACGVMFVLVKLSEDFQYYNEEAPLQPAHTKNWFRFYKAYFILSLLLSSYNIATSPCFCKISSLISKRRKTLKNRAQSNHIRSLAANTSQTSNSEERVQPVSINRAEGTEVLNEFPNKCEFQKPLLLKDCLISFEPHKGIESSHKKLGNSLKSNEIYSPEEEHSVCLNYSYPPGFMAKESVNYKRSDNIRSVEKEKQQEYLKIRKKENKKEVYK